MKNGFIVIGIITAGLLSFSNRASAIEVAPRISDREIIEGLADIRGDIKELRAEIKSLEEGQKALQQQLAELKDSTNKRIDDTNKRIDELRIDNQRQFDNLYNLILWGFGILFAGMMTLVGFVLWDRRTALSPAIRKNKELEEREDKVEKILKEYAWKEPRLAEILRNVGLM